MIEFDEPTPRRPFETMVPLINVVFLLLIFFLLAGTMQPGEDVDVTLPSGQVDDRDTQQPLTIIVEKDGFVWLGKSVVDPALSGYRIGDYIKTSNAVAVAIKSDAQAPAESVLRLMEELRKAGVKQVTILTEPAG
ncbi:MAG: hypothetical protein GC184_11665 [Rhizobiales bacterium]|nr:hypothetical protein [Hyphomicrobiales bacterium]